MREDLKEGGHGLAEVLLNHLLSDAQADEGDETDRLHTQDSPGLGPTWEPRNRAHEFQALPEGPDQSTSKGCEADQSKPDKEMEAQENNAAYSELELGQNMS